MKPIFFVLFFFLIAFSAFSQQTISGFVTDEANGESMIAVNCYLKDTGIGTVSNKSGYYVINNVPVGRWTVVFTYIGYKRHETEVTVGPDAHVKLSVQLTESAVEKEKIQVISYRQEEKEMVKPSTIRITPRKIEAAPQMAEADLMRMLQMLPGVLTLSEFSSGLYIRGSTPDQNLILLDGTEVYNVNHLFGIFSTFDVDAIKEAELLKGGFPAHFGGRLSSVLDITNKDGNQKRVEGKASIGLVSAKASLQGPLWRGSWFISGRRTYLNYLIDAMKSSAKDEEKEMLESIPDYYFYDFHVKVYQDISFRNKLALTYFQGSDIMDFDVDPFKFGMDWGNRTFTAKWTHIISDRFFINTYATWSRYAMNMDEDDVFINFTFKNSIEDYTGKMDLEYYPHQDHIVRAGLQYKHLNAHYEQKYGDFGITLKSSASHASGYIQDNWALTGLLRLQAGIRFNYYMPHEFSNSFGDVTYQGNARFDWEPRLSLRYQWTENLASKIAWGRYKQYTTIVSFGSASFSFMDIWFPCDNSYEPSDGYHYITGVEGNMPFGLKGSAELYYKDMGHLYEFNPNTNTVNDGSGLFYAGAGYAYGADFYLEKNTGRLTGWLSYGLGYTWRKFPDLNQGRPYFPKYDRRHSFNLVATYQLSRSWKLNAAWSYGTGQAYTRATSQYELHMPDRTVPVIIGEQRNISRLPPYHRMDLGIRYAKKLNTKILKQWGFYLQIFNLYNRGNVWFRYVDVEQQPPEALEIRMLPIIPTVGFDFHF